jgi:hypothetical protein
MGRAKGDPPLGDHAKGTPPLGDIDTLRAARYRSVLTSIARASELGNSPAMPEQARQHRI